MTLNARPVWFALLVVALAGTGCEQVSDNNPSAANPKPEVATTSPDSKPTPATPDVPKEKAESATPEKESPGASATPAKLEKVTYDQFLKRVANKDAKYTMVDCWATWCGPCKENFPHVVAMNQKYAGKGLAVASLSFDDPADAKQVGEAEKFLNEKKATFTNYLLDEPNLGGFEKLNINAIPAVFVYGPDGKEVKRFTLDDPNNQFTYDEVEETIAALLDGKPLPEKPKAAKPSK